MAMQAESRARAERNLDRPLPFWACVLDDLIAHIPPDQRQRSPWSWVLVTVRIMARSSGFHATLCYRVAHSLHHRVGVLGRALSGVLFWCNRHLYGCSIAPTARLHGGLVLPHPQGIVVGRDVVMGPRAWIFQNATLGGAPGVEGMPKVGADARIFAGAVLAGPIRVGDHVLVGANAVIYRDVSSYAAVRCPPSEFSPLPALFTDDESEQ
jgi:serine acetyltransferase